MSPCLPRLECPLSVYSFGHGADQREAAVASNFSVLVFLSKNGLKPDLSEQLGADHREARTAAVRPGQPSLPASSKPSSPGSSAFTGAALSVVSHRRVSTSSPRLSPGAASAFLPVLPTAASVRDTRSPVGRLPTRTPPPSPWPGPADAPTSAVTLRNFLPHRKSLFSD